ncbi:MAG: DarT ssDNA thymidine ADP-ribosyltransferase family protein [Microcella sp.]|uniref:DarT ssDNA thymidine ADP-ribosyltransferase family protein n=1 Tax=Microcella sp. TaxID=1913979 RepID=UPI003315A5F7
MSEECVHGFEPGMCATCYPPPEPQQPAPARRSPRTAARSLRSPAPGATGKAAEVRPPNLPHRMFHVTHVSNLPAILDAGELRPSSTAAPALKLASAITDELRSTAPVDDERTVADCVPFSLSPLATWWGEVQDGAAGPTWSEEARAASTVDFVVLGVDVGAVEDDLVVSDGDAAAVVTSLARTLEDRRRMLARAAADATVLQAVEALVPGTVPLEKVALVAVANEPRRDEVRALLRSAGVTIKVAVYPPWFVPVVAE